MFLSDINLPAFSARFVVIGSSKKVNMDESIPTPEQRLRVCGLRVLKNIPPDEPVVAGVTAEDVVRMSLNREFAENGLDGVRLVESQVDQ